MLDDVLNYNIFYLQEDAESGKFYISSTLMRMNPLYMSLYIFWSKFIFIELIPYFTVLVRYFLNLLLLRLDFLVLWLFYNWQILNVFILLEIKKSSKFRSRFQQRGEDDSKRERGVPLGPRSSNGNNSKINFS